MDSFPSDFAQVAETKEYTQAQSMLLNPMRSILLPITQDPRDQFLVEMARYHNVTSLLGGTEEDETNADVHCGFQGLVRQGTVSAPYWLKSVIPTDLFLTATETAELLSALPKPNRIAMVQGAYAIRYNELSHMSRTQNKLQVYGGDYDIHLQISALDEACGLEIQRILRS